MKRRSTRINREMGRVQYLAIIEDNPALDSRWERLHKISQTIAKRMGTIWMN
jgi:hypothetical protein